MLTINLIFCMFFILFFINKAFKNFLISSSFFFSLFCISPIKQHVVSVFQPEISNLLSCRVLCLIIKVLLIMRNEYKKSIRRKTSDAEGKPWKICVPARNPQTCFIRKSAAAREHGLYNTAEQWYVHNTSKHKHDTCRNSCKLCHKNHHALLSYRLSPYDSIMQFPWAYRTKYTQRE